MSEINNQNNKEELARVAANGLINRRHLLGLGLAGAGGLIANSVLAADASRVNIPAWSKVPGRDPSAYGNPSSYTGSVKRLAGNPSATLPGSGASRTPLHLLQGNITPNSLHFERHHAGIPDIDPAQHRLVIHGMVRQPLEFSYEDLLAYPLHSRIYFLECSGNSGANGGANAGDDSAATIHGLLSCAEWTGVSLATLLDETGIAEGASWVTSTGADGASMGRSIPLNKALRDVFIALYQNGEPIRPEQGYPMRLFVPGWEGNVSVKWLTQIKLADGPANFRDETSKYTDMLPDKKALQFTYPMGVKSLITSPSGQMRLRRQGLHEISGLAWSGAGAISRVEVSADAGRTWADAHLDGTGQALALTRFRIPWLWEGGPAVLQSRATDATGQVQPTRASVLSNYDPINRYHFNGIQSWAVSAQGEVKNVFA